MSGISKLDLAGHAFGRLTAVGRAENRGRYTRWRCKCSCGNRCVVTTQSLRRGATRSCGCLQREQGPKSARHYWARTPVTFRQQRLLVLLQSVGPVSRNRCLAARAGYASSGSVHYALRALERKGYVERAGAAWLAVRQLSGAVGVVS